VFYLERKSIDNNARKALKQLRIEMASEYGVDRDFVFDAIENASTGGVLQGYFKNIPSVEGHKKTNSKHGE